MNKVKYYRLQADITGKQLAEKTGIPLRTIRAIERNEINTSFINMCKIADVLNVALEQLREY